MPIHPRGLLPAARPTPPPADSETVEIVFTPALPGPAIPGSGWLQPGGLVVHTGWRKPYRPADGDTYHQDPAHDGYQSWQISTPDGHEIACFAYYSRPDAERAASVIAAALPGQRWPATWQDCASVNALHERAFDASTGPEMLPRTDSEGRPDWGYGADWIHWRMPPTRALYERMIAKHGGRAPRTCRSCRTSLSRGRRDGWLVRTGHWPRWAPEFHPPGQVRKAHCFCQACTVPVTIGVVGQAVDVDGQSVPGSLSTTTMSPLPLGLALESGERDVPWEQRPLAWFQRMLAEGGHVILDSRPCTGLWPDGVRHDDAALCESGFAATDFES
ncbi:hypothetical protein N4G70_35890 [Streptomyces sp. ASQP_92]|uniref:hypothetical protein n=1 Tax=Streptomyces sp. ASQP_92 TaxID=2979116 RepID=UPI0021BF310B|nr:hypothetical protein [Streptomyces sp. ASQP_92]MCT9094184.1 hypothetical protein [Streptomyces sp. ASQP_92]